MNANKYPAFRTAHSKVITVSGSNVLTEPTRALQRVGAQLQSAALQDKITPRG